MTHRTNDTTHSIRETSRWLRVGFFSFTILGPVINSLVTRLRTLPETPSDGGRPVSGYGDARSVKPALSASLLELKDSPYARELLRRSEELAEELRARGISLSQVLAERSGRLSQDIGEHSNELAQELVKFSNKASKKLLKQSEQTMRKLAKNGGKRAKGLDKRNRKIARQLVARGERVAKELSKRSRAISRDVVQQSGARWTLMGFGVGAVVAGLTAYIFVRRRMQQIAEEEQHILLSQNGYNGNGLGPITAWSANGPLASATKEKVVPDGTVSSATAEQVPDAVLLGVISTKRYYPIETPLDQLRTEKGEVVEVIYFRSEEEAREQGYSGAE